MKVRRTEKIKVDLFRVGDVIRFKLSDGEKVEMLAVKEENDGMIFCFADCLAKEYSMNAQNTNAGGWDASDLRKKLNGEILDRFPQKIRKLLMPFENGDLLRLPTEKEIFGSNPCGEDEPESVSQWKPMKQRKNRIASQGLNGGWEWCASPFRFVVCSPAGCRGDGAGSLCGAALLRCPAGVQAVYR